MNKKDVGRKIKEFRNLQGLTQAELAEAVHMHEKQISRIEAGVHFPTFDNFMKILSVLNVEMKDFDISQKVEKNSLRKRTLKIIQRANNKELKFYASVLEAMQKCLDETEEAVK